MISFIKEHPKAVLVAVIVHLVFVAVLVVSFRFSDKIFDSPPQIDVVEAVAVDEAKVERELKKIEDAERRRQDELNKAKAERKREERRLAELKKKRAAEKKRQAELKKKRDAERKAEQARLEKLKAEQKAEQERLVKLEAEQKALAEKKRQEEERLAALAIQRQQEEERRRQADQERREKELKQKLEAEQQRLNEARSAQRVSEIEKYTQRIYAEIYRAWTVPLDGKEGLITEVRVRLIPSGDVVTVDVAKSSGDPVFDRSVTNAIQKASPLPVPPVNSGLFEEFRDLTLRLKKKT